MNHKLERADCIVVLGSHDIRVAERGAKLFRDGWAPLIIFSGGLGNLTRKIWKKSEAEIFSDIALKMGVPKDKILVENKSTNTGENVVFTRRLLRKRGIRPKKIVAVHKPYMERRAYATFKKLWPGVKIVVTSPQISFNNYPNKEITREHVINIMVGDLQRIKIYSEKGFQINQKVPQEVLDAYKRLVKLNYTKHLIK